MISEKMVARLLAVLFGFSTSTTTQEIVVPPLISLPQYYGFPYSAVLPSMLSGNQNVPFPYANEEYPWQADLYEHPKNFAGMKSLPYSTNLFEAKQPQTILPPYFLEILGRERSDLPSWPQIWLTYSRLQKSAETPTKSYPPEPTGNSTSEIPLKAITYQSTSELENESTTSIPPFMDSTVEDSISSDEDGTEAEDSTPHSPHPLDDVTTPSYTTIEPSTDGPLSTNLSESSLTISPIFQNLFDLYRERVPFINIVLSGSGNWSISFLRPSQNNISSDSVSIITPKAIQKISSDEVTDILILAKNLESKIANIFKLPGSVSATGDGAAGPKNGFEDWFSHATASLQDHSTDDEQLNSDPVLTSSQEGI